MATGAMFKLSGSNLAISSLIGFGLISLLFIWHRKRKYVHVGTIKKLIIYPMKSLPGIQVDCLQLTKSGVKYATFYDRSFILVNKSRVMITIRNQPKLALLRQEIHDDQLWIVDPDESVLKLNTANIVKHGSRVQTEVWKKPLEGIDCGDEAACWFEKFLSIPGVRLLYHADGLGLVPSREAVGKTQVPFTQNQVRYQDDCACLIINDGSVLDLNERVPSIDVDFRRFRPNLLVEAPPYDEDSWKYIKVGSCALKRLKYCTRCVATTVNPDTAEKAEEPLKTLKKYRKPACGDLYQTHPLFGTNCGVEVEGTVAVGDEIHAHKLYESCVQ